MTLQMRNEKSVEKRGFANEWDDNSDGDDDGDGGGGRAAAGAGGASDTDSAQEKEEEMIIYRREHDLENKRAIAGGGIIVNAGAPISQNVEQKEDLLETLQKLKKLLDSEIISQTEFDNKKTEILSKM